ncbi:MAG TPA: sialate O-acetylesterase [Burkholderiales bacterium]|nr:sialate O-acetylesterase [Burkholderiales bacterium]
MKRAVLAVAALVAVAGAYLAGLHSGYTRDSILQELIALKRAWIPRAGDVDQYERTVRTDRAPIACPEQTPDTLVVIVAGQSNAASVLSRRHVGTARVVNYFRGACYAALDPLVGSSGRAGSVWVEMANLLGRDVVLIPMAVPATKIADWNGRLAPLVDETLRDAKRRYTVTHLAWMQGEGDAGTTPPAAYRAELEKLIARAKAAFPALKFYVSQTTHCFGVERDDGIRQAQKAVTDAARGVLPGPDTDRYTAIEDRSDGCHLAEAGQARVAREWARVLGADQARIVSSPPM